MLAPLPHPGCINHGCMVLIGICFLPVLFLYIGVGGNWLGATLAVGAAILFASFAMALLRIANGDAPATHHKIDRNLPAREQDAYWNER
jgi:hypothetical protein